ncbi:hypothetical protein DM02DRAFT_95150 [Periconia macrospinosa]|uniref:Uncharacterized protein n=1 Tax=Periconia macrospinosa TaxID=97972 RepID=A0A2V1DHG0_9PLEO|nr:hypothetical protein DM02DRAFT_95150 [Periconia macrospinosa]
MINIGQQQAAGQLPPDGDIIPMLITQISESVQYHWSQGKYEIAKAHTNLLNQIIEIQSTGYHSTLLNQSEDSWTLQVEQISKFLSDVDLDPDARLDSATRFRDATRHRSLHKLPPFWFSTKYRKWKDTKGSSLLMVEGTFRLKSQLQSLCVEMIELVRKESIPVLWALKTPDDPSVSAHLPLNIFKSLVFQSLRVNPILRNQNIAGLTYADFQNAVTEEDWMKLLGRTTMGIPELMILVDIELFGPVSFMSLAAGSLSVPFKFLRHLENLMKLNPNTSLKIILVSYGSRAFATVGLQEKVIHLGGTARKQVPLKLRMTSMAQKKSFVSRKQGLLGNKAN